MLCSIGDRIMMRSKFGPATVDLPRRAGQKSLHTLSISALERLLSALVRAKLGSNRLLTRRAHAAAPQRAITMANPIPREEYMRLLSIRLPNSTATSDPAEAVHARRRFALRPWHSQSP